MATKSNYIDKIPIWNSKKVKGSFVILSEHNKEMLPVTRIEKWESISEVVERFFNKKNKEYIFRGQRRSDWKLTPSIMRGLDIEEIEESLMDEHLNYFKKSIRGRIKDYSVLDDDDELWSIGQHHFLKTPLLDWTHSPYVALFFAFKEEENARSNRYRAIYAIDKSLIPKDKESDNLRIVEPEKDHHGRLVSQDGLFTICKYDTTIDNEINNLLLSGAFEENLGNLSNAELPHAMAKYICKIYVKNNKQSECLKYLENMNIHHASLFPDILGSAEYCNAKLTKIMREKAKQKIETAKILHNLFKESALPPDYIETVMKTFKNTAPLSSDYIKVAMNAAKNAPSPTPDYIETVMKTFKNASPLSSDYIEAAMNAAKNTPPSSSDSAKVVKKASKNSHKDKKSAKKLSENQDRKKLNKAIESLLADSLGKQVNTVNQDKLKNITTDIVNNFLHTRSIDWENKESAQAIVRTRARRIMHRYRLPRDSINFVAEHLISTLKEVMDDKTEGS